MANELFRPWGILLWFASGLFWNEKVSFCKELLAVLISRLGNQRNGVLHSMNVKVFQRSGFDYVSLGFEGIMQV